MDEITIVEVPTQKVIAIREKGKYQRIPELLGTLYEFSMTKGIQITGPPVYLCHEKCVDEVMKADQEGTADIEVAFPVATDVEGKDAISCYELAGGQMAKIIHKGPYENCGSAYEKLYSWLEQNGKIINGPTREVYLNDPREVTPEEIITEIYAPIA